LTSATWIVPEPEAGQPFTTVGGGDWMTAVGTEVAEVEPALLLAVTVTRSVPPASTCPSLYVSAVAPLIAAQLLPVSSQRLHPNACPVGLPLHEPFAAVRVEPTCGAPEMVGACVVPGVVAAAMTAVGADVEDADPSALLAVTVTRRVCPTSADPTVYLLAVTPVIAVHASPFWLHRDQAYV
jgi:hypothetical protein